MTSWTVRLALVSLMLTGGVARAAVLPPHGPLRILIVSDEVNPHNLSDAELTQPGEISAALNDPASGVNIDPAPEGVREIATNDLPLATAALSVEAGDPAAYDVLIYFAHRIPTGGSGAADQAAFDAAVESFLVSGGGVVSFHHGAFTAAGKTGILDIIGGTASSIEWNTAVGQDVINVAPGHFVTTNGVTYAGTKAYADPGRGVALDDYEFFTNVPDERYPVFNINPSADDVTMLFGSDYSSGSHVLGFTHQRPAWQGIVVAYQPGEYQPNALDDLAGNNFQVLANAIVFAAGASAPAPVPSMGPAGFVLLTLLLVGAALAPGRLRDSDAWPAESPRLRSRLRWAG